MKNNKKNFHINLTNEKLEISKYISSEFGTTDGSEVIFLGITRDNNFDRSVENYFMNHIKTWL